MFAGRRTKKVRTRVEFWILRLIDSGDESRSGTASSTLRPRWMTRMKRMMRAKTSETVRCYCFLRILT